MALFYTPCIADELVPAEAPTSAYPFPYKPLIAPRVIHYAAFEVEEYGRAFAQRVWGPRRNGRMIRGTLPGELDPSGVYLSSGSSAGNPIEGRKVDVSKHQGSWSDIEGTEVHIRGLSATRQFGFSHPDRGNSPLKIR